MIAVVKCRDCGVEYELYRAEKWLTYEQLNGMEYVVCKNCCGLAYVRELRDEY